jgi:SAM-dependent methyltransferase
MAMSMLVPRPPRVRLLCEGRLRDVLRQYTLILDVGSGGRRLGSGVVSLDIGDQSTLDVRADACCLPFRDGTFDLCVCTSVLEHVRGASIAMTEIGRVTRNSGALWLEVPFLYHFHTGGEDEHDYTRWTERGVRQFVESAGFEIVEIGPNIGPGTALRLTAAETLALLFWQRAHTATYYFARSVLGWALIWLSWLDKALLRSTLAHRVAGGFYVYAVKRSAPRDAPI